MACLAIQVGNIGVTADIKMIALSLIVPWIYVFIKIFSGVMSKRPEEKVKSFDDQLKVLQALLCMIANEKFSENDPCPYKLADLDAPQKESIFQAMKGKRRN